MTPEDFNQTLEFFTPRFKASARAHPVPGWEPEDLQNEMAWALWKACMTFDPKKGSVGDNTLGAYWWTIWTRDRAKLLGKNRAAKQIPRVTMVDDVDVFVTKIAEENSLLLPPKALSSLEKKVWILISYGFTVREITSLLKISNFMYYKVLQNLRTEEIRNYLKDQGS